MSEPGERRSHGPRLLQLAGCGVSLLGLAGISFGLSYVGLGAWAMPVALGIAVSKAALVLLAFMELSQQTASVKLGAALASLMLALLVGLMVADIATREPSPLPAPLGRTATAP